MVRQLIGTRQILQFYLPGVRRVPEAEVSGCNLFAGLPVPGLNAVLRATCDERRGDDIPAGIGVLPLGDPYLPIDFFCPKSKVIAFNAADHTAAEVLDVNDIQHQCIVDIRQQQIRRRQRPVMLLPQLIDQVIDRAGHCRLRPQTRQNAWRGSCRAG